MRRSLLLLAVVLGLVCASLIAISQKPATLGNRRLAIFLTGFSQGRQEPTHRVGFGIVHPGKELVQGTIPVHLLFSDPETKT